MKTSNLVNDDRLTTAEGVRDRIVQKLLFVIGRDPNHASQRDWLNAVLYAIRDIVTENWLRTQRASKSQSARRVYYLSMEFLMGRS